MDYKPETYGRFKIIFEDAYGGRAVRAVAYRNDMTEKPNTVVFAPTKEKAFAKIKQVLY
jgi:hypothetical protein